MRGRPTTYTDEISDRICEMIATTSKSMKTILEEVGVPYGTHLQWLRDRKDYSSKYARAKEDQADLLAEEIIEIADDKSADVTVNEDGLPMQNTEFMQRAKLRVDARKWVASKLKPKKYGDRMDLTNDGEAFPTPVIKVIRNDSGDRD